MVHEVEFKLSVMADAIGQALSEGARCEPDSIKQAAIDVIWDATVDADPDDREGFEKEAGEVADLLLGGAEALRARRNGPSSDPFEKPNLTPFAFALGCACASAQMYQTLRRGHEAEAALKALVSTMAGSR